MFCDYSGFIQWLRGHLLACPFKQLTGFDCPGCGFQRSVISLLQGNIVQSLHYYPATIPLLVTALYLICGKYAPLTKNQEQIKKGLYVFTGIIIVGSYLVKLSGYV